MMFCIFCATDERNFESWRFTSLLHSLNLTLDFVRIHGFSQNPSARIHVNPGNQRQNSPPVSYIPSVIYFRTFFTTNTHNQSPSPSTHTHTHLLACNLTCLAPQESLSATSHLSYRYIFNVLKIEWRAWFAVLRDVRTYPHTWLDFIGYLSVNVWISNY